MPLPQMEPLNEYSLTLAKMVASTSYLPHPYTVGALNGAAFPTQRYRNRYPKLSLILNNDVEIGMYDDNTTPRWALLWSHGFADGQRNGWGFAHVWQVSDDMKAYTNIANLAMIPECFGTLTDKKGPLTGYLQWHAWKVYGWKPDGMNVPTEPPDYNQLEWRYLNRTDAPRELINERILRRDNQRLRILRPIMNRLGMLQSLA